MQARIGYRIEGFGGRPLLMGGLGPEAPAPSPKSGPVPVSGCVRCATFAHPANVRPILMSFVYTCGVQRHNYVRWGVPDATRKIDLWTSNAQLNQTITICCAPGK